MKLDKEQQKRVEENLGLVGKVIKDRVHGLDRNGIFTYEDLYQIGCIGLCKAAATDRGSGSFSTYAYRLIWNEICDALIAGNKRQAHEILTDEELPAHCTRRKSPVRSIAWMCSLRWDMLLTLPRPESRKGFVRSS